ncbi:hypothetical protein DER44DRAFT_180217 [Fusarium oxysporum]|nr:hypothetical protein DER44DRAFT_180217 [Fusarium oxysporum]
MASATSCPPIVPDPFDLGIHTPANLNRGARTALLQNSPSAVNGPVWTPPAHGRTVFASQCNLYCCSYVPRTACNLQNYTLFVRAPNPCRDYFHEITSFSSVHAGWISNPPAASALVRGSMTTSHRGKPTVPITTSNSTQCHFFWALHHSFDLRFWVRIRKMLGAVPRFHGFRY